MPINFYLGLLEGEACHINLRVHQHILEKSSMFNSFLSLQNLFSSSGLVKISASWSSMPTLSMQMSPFCWWSLMKWWRTSMCFVLACWTGLLVNLIALSLSHSNGTLLNLIPKLFKVAFIPSRRFRYTPPAIFEPPLPFFRRQKRWQKKSKWGWKLPYVMSTGPADKFDFVEISTLAIWLQIRRDSTPATVTPLLRWLSTKHNLIDLAKKVIRRESKSTSKKVKHTIWNCKYEWHEYQ